MKFRKKLVVIEATQWLKDGDHPRVTCGGPLHTHGYIALELGGNIVCPGDWIIDGSDTPCKPDIFAATYEPVQ